MNSLLLLCLILAVYSANSALPSRFSGHGKRFVVKCEDTTDDSLEVVLSIRGGVKAKPKTKSKEKLKVNSLNSKKGTIKAVKEMIAGIKPATRLYLGLCVFCTLVHVIGLPAPELFALSASRVWELWRPFTAMAYLGAPSMSMANSAYFLVRYGQQLETLNGLGAHAWFLLTQTIILSILGIVFGFPNMAQAMIAATVYVSSHLNPMERFPFQFGFMITSWQLPFAMMAIDCLSVRMLSLITDYRPY